MRLLLTSQGISPELKDTFLSLLPKSPTETSVVFITTAAYGEEENPEWLEVYRNQLRNLGIINIEDLDLKDKTEDDLRRALSDKDIIFVNGGNTFYLLYWVKKSGFDKVVLDELKKGKLYVGISAGSYICCPTIEASGWKPPDSNRVSLTDLTALNLVPFLITAHFEENYRSAVEKRAMTCKFPVVALYDTQAVLVENGKYKVVGKGQKEFFNGFYERL